jgi:hypothetical protein
MDLSSNIKINDHLTLNPREEKERRERRGEYALIS